jgi:hypothetical protein
MSGGTAVAVPVIAARADATGISLGRVSSALPVMSAWLAQVVPRTGRADANLRG